jgi:hypothetical protein
LLNVLPDLFADGAYFVEREGLGVWELPVDAAQAGCVTGHTSSLQVETAMLAQARSWASSLCGTWSLASMPISFNASRTCGCGAIPGSLPALRTSCLAGFSERFVPDLVGKAEQAPG